MKKFIGCCAYTALALAAVLALSSCGQKNPFKGNTYEARLPNLPASMGTFKIVFTSDREAKMTFPDGGETAVSYAFTPKTRSISFYYEETNQETLNDDSAAEYNEIANTDAFKSGDIVRIGCYGTYEEDASAIALCEALFGEDGALIFTDDSLEIRFEKVSEKGSDGDDSSGHSKATDFSGAGWYIFYPKGYDEDECYIEWDSKGNCLRIGSPYVEMTPFLDEEDMKDFSYSVIKKQESVEKISDSDLPYWAK